MALLDFQPLDKALVEARRARRTPKSASSPNRFVEIPMAAVEAVGLCAERGPTAGKVKSDLALLAGAAWYAQLNAGRERVCHLETGDEVGLAAHEVWFSMESVGRNLFARWGMAGGPAFKTFYGATKDAFERLEKAGQIVTLGYPLGRKRGRLGRVWTFTGTPTGDAIGHLRETPPPAALVTRPAADRGDLGAAARPFERDGMVNVVDLLTGLRAGDLDLPAEHTHVQVAEQLASRRSLRVYSRWAPKKAREGDAVPGDHGTTGLFRKSDIGDDRRPVDGASTFVPYLVIEIDRPTPAAARSARRPGHIDPHEGKGWVDVEAVETSASVAGRFVRALAGLGLAPKHVRVCFSGGSGFHVYVPAGAFGSPVFADADRAKPVLARFVASVLDEDVDEAVLSPRHLVRAVGARHQDTRKYKLALSGYDFLQTSPLDLYDLSETFAPSRLPGPRSVAPVPDLVRLFVEALGDDAPPAPSRAGLQSLPGIDEPERWPAIFQQALGGCGKGELWWPGKAGRDSLLYELACFLLERADRTSATALLEQVNARCVPPLAPRRLEAKIDSAERTVSRKGS